MTTQESAPACRSRPPTPESPSWSRHAVYYGIDIARFFDADDDGFGDLPGLTAKLDYLQQLGVTCLWLLPFFPSARRDNGYDVTNYLGIDPRFGDLDDFRRLAEQAHLRGIRLIIDLVVHHTSAKHPWFQAAESDPKSRYVDYYIWSREKPQDAASDNVFPEEEQGIWAYSERAGAYFRHKFYSFQPDLRLANEEVWNEVKRILDFWISLGTDGFRIDAATHLFADTGLPDADAPFGRRLDDLRSYLHERAPHVALLGEADVQAHEIRPYFEHGRFNLLYNFLSNNSIYLALVRESAVPLTGTITGLRDVVLEGRMLNFIRNVDELDLEQLSPEERDEVFAALAPGANMRIYGRGVRRGWAPMMRNSAQLRMTMSLLFALPGVPLLMYGQEIGMGDDLSRGGRDSVRLTMQWSDGPGGEFSGRTSGGVTDAAQADGPYGYRRINVRAQQDDPDSPLNLVRRLIALRAEHPEIGESDWQIRNSGNEALLILDYGTVTVIHNFSRHPQPLPEPAFSRVLLGADLGAGAGAGAGTGQVPGYGFSWLLR